MNKRPAFKDFGVAYDGGGGADVMDLDTDEVKESLRKTGFVLLTGFEIDTAKFELFSNRFSSDYMDHRGGGSLRSVINKDGDKTILSVAYNYKKKANEFSSEEQKTFPLALHSDRSYTRSRPPLMWFYCANPPREEGETIVCDGVDIYRRLSESTRELFDTRDIRYIRHYGDGEWQLWAQTDKREEVAEYCESMGLNHYWDDDNAVTTEFDCRAVIETQWGGHKGFVNSMLLVLWQEEELGMTRSLVRMDDGSRIPAEVIDEIRRVSDAITHEVEWRPCDITMIDNTRVMHGRRSFTDPQRQVYVRMCRSLDW